MKSSKHRNCSTRRRFVLAFICMGLLLLINSDGSAQPQKSPEAAIPVATVTPAAASPKTDEQSTQDFARIRAEHEEARREKLAGSTWYYFLVTLSFLAILVVPFVLAVYRGITRLPGTGNGPLGLPVGSMRSILAYSLVVYLGFHVLTSVLSISLFAPPDYLLGLAATVIGFYFGSRSVTEPTLQSPMQTNTLWGTVTKPDGSPAPLAHVVLFQGGVKTFERVADGDGEYRVDKVANGEYEVEASLAPHTPSVRSKVKLNSGGQPKRIDLRLR